MVPWLARQGLIVAALTAFDGCTHRHNPPDLVTGDAYLDPRHLTVYHRRSWSSGETWSEAAIEAILMDRLGEIYVLAGHMSLPPSIHVTLRVKDTAGDILAEHPLAIGHNRWRDSIPYEPLDLYLHIATWRFGHDFLLQRVPHPHDGPINLNVVTELMHRE